MTTPSAPGFDEWWDKACEDRETIDLKQRDFTELAWNAGRAAAMKEIEDRWPSNSYLDEHFTMLVNKFVDSNHRVYIRDWMFKTAIWLKQKLFEEIK